MELFIQETNRRLERIENKLEELHSFKIEMLATSRTVSFIVSAISGLITLVATALTIKK